MAQPAKTPDAASVPFASAFNLFAPSIEVLKRNITSYVLFLFVPLALTIIGSIGMPDSSPSDPLAPFKGVHSALLGVGYILILLTMPALLTVLIRGAQARTIAPDEALSYGLKRLFRLIGLFFVMGLIFGVSFLLLIVPFFFMLPRYIMAPYYLMDQDLSIGQALKASAADSKKYRGAIWGVIGVQVLLSLAGIVPILGTIASTVLAVLYEASYAVRYEQMKAVNNGQAPVSPIEKELAKKNQA